MDVLASLRGYDCQHSAAESNNCGRLLFSAVGKRSCCNNVCGEKAIMVEIHRAEGLFATDLLLLRGGRESCREWLSQSGKAVRSLRIRYNYTVLYQNPTSMLQIPDLFCNAPQGFVRSSCV